MDSVVMFSREPVPAMVRIGGVTCRSGRSSSAVSEYEAARPRRGGEGPAAGCTLWESLPNRGVGKKFLRPASLLSQFCSKLLPTLRTPVELAFLGRARGEHCHPSTISGVQAALFCK
jgi:hypothetical protein